MKAKVKMVKLIFGTYGHGASDKQKTIKVKINIADFRITNTINEANKKTDIKKECLIFDKNSEKREN